MSAVKELARLAGLTIAVLVGGAIFVAGWCHIAQWLLGGGW